MGSNDEVSIVGSIGCGLGWQTGFSWTNVQQSMGMVKVGVDSMKEINL